MKKDLTWIVTVLDESGSMEQLKKSTINSYNEFIDEQKTLDGMAEVTLVKFNSDINKVYENIDIKNVLPLNDDNYQPSKMTKLYDAIGSTINIVKENIKKLSDENRPEKVLFVIITDGQENRSEIFNKEKVFKKISKRESKGWCFLYLGANQDSMLEGGKIGINIKKTVTWEANELDVKNIFKATSNYTNKFRSMKNLKDLNLLDMNAEYNEVKNNEKSKI